MNHNIWSEPFLRRQAEKKIKRRIPDQVWQYLVDDRSVSQVTQDPEELDWLVTQIERLEKLLNAVDLSSKAGAMFSPAETPRRQRRNKVVSARNDAVSEFIAERARNDEAVRRFRKRYLFGGLLSPSNVKTWIDKQSWDYTHALVVRIPRGTPLPPDPEGLSLIPGLASVKGEQIEGLMAVDSIAYQQPLSPDCRSRRLPKSATVALIGGGGYVQKKAIGRDGVLRTLLLLSKELAGTYGWTEVQATMFVLTDVTPQIATARWGISPVVPLACLTSVSLTIDLQVTPEELAKKYRTIRSKILGPKHRSLGEKHCRLAVFALKHQDLNQDALRAWNTQHPKWSYGKLSRFAKEARLATHRQEAQLERLPFHPTKLYESFESLATEGTAEPSSGAPADPNSGSG